MAFTKTWDETNPDGATVDANTIDTVIKDDKIAVRERITSITGVSSGNFNVDPFDPTKYGPNVTITGDNVHPTLSYNNGTIVGGTVTVNYSNGNDQRVTLGSNTTISLTAGTVIGQAVLLDVIYGGAYTTTWGASVKHTNNTTPSPTVSTGTSTQYFLRWNGTVWQCTMSNTGVPTT